MASTPDLSALQRPSGAFAMLAIDQRESMRAMFADTQAGPVSDRQLVDFKLEALRHLTPHASAVLIDRPFGWQPALEAGAVAPGCGLIAAADEFHASADEIVADAGLDDLVVPEAVKAQGAQALKLLVVWRPDGNPEKRIALVDEFVARCRRAGLISLIEPVSRKPLDGRPHDLHDGILAAARELGNRGQDIYKAEVPLHAAGEEAEVRRRCAELTDAIASPWVVLSSGVAPDRFPTAVEWACREGARGFLAGRAVWKETIGAPDMAEALRTTAVDRLKRLCETVDRAVG
ncbi:aldolase (plasmid) [Cereibacter azotoformans]|uniref:Sulfofructosephosphate aldolase n=1 Tax=Cereibacter azotoformans TaxID=43057 RepID=A0A2T5JVP3_9RHOB|nr:aldolase [Cereibacter azotoformans]PTR14253.1 sulfofructosephosphate aldolase [Cereibacter azotoformans]